MLEKNRGALLSWCMKMAGIFLRRKQWFLFPFISSMILSAVLIILLTQFHESSPVLRVMKDALDAGNIEASRRSIETLRAQVDREDAEMLQFRQMYKNELSERLKINLRVLGQLHVELFETKQAVKEKESREEAYGTAGALAADLKDKQRILGGLRKRYPDGHQKVVELKREIQEIARKIAKRGDHPVAPMGPEKTLTALKEREAQLTHGISTYERRIEETPNREQALSTLLNKRNRTLIAYQSLLQEKPSSMSVSFRVGVNGMLLGFLIGMALVVFREKTDRTIRTQDELGRLLSVPIILSIFDYKKVVTEDVAKPSTMRSAASKGASLYGPKTLFLVKDRR